LTAINLASIGVSKGAQNLLTSLEGIGLATVVLAGVFWAEPEAFRVPRTAPDSTEAPSHPANRGVAS
jgi:hypothetical protein